MKKNLSLMKCYMMLSLAIVAYTFSNPIYFEAAVENTFSVSPVLPKNQIKTTNSYYDLLIKPGMTQELELNIFNHSDREETYIIDINPATTNENGILDYTTKEDDYQFDSSLLMPITNFAFIDSREIKIPAKKNGKVKIKITIPKEGIQGIVVGGIRTSIKSEKEVFGNQINSSMKINNKINYNIGLNLRMEEKPKVKAELKLLNVEAGIYNGRNVITALVQNSEPMVLNDIEYGARIYKEGNRKVLFERFISGMRMAPNSNFNYNISLENDHFKVGNYQIEMQAESKETKQKWQWTKKFEVSKEEAKRLNEEAIGLEDSYWWLYMLIAFMLLAIVGLVFTVIILQNKMKKKHQKKRKKSKKKL